MSPCSFSFASIFCCHPLYIAKIFNLNSNVNKNAVVNNLNAATTDFEFLTTPPTCAADGSHALTFPSGSFSCTSITGSGGSAGGGVLGYSGSALTLPTSGATFLAPVGGALASATEANVTANAPAAAAISMLYVSISAAPGTGNSIAFIYRDAGSSTALTCTMSGATATTCNDTAHSFTPTVGDALSVQVVTSGTVVIAPAIKIIAEYGVSGGSSSGMLASFFTANSETTSSTTPVDLTTADTITFTLSATTNVVINYTAYNTLTNTPDGLFNELNIDGSTVSASIFECDSFNSTGRFMCGLGYKVSLGSGSHTIKVQHYVASSTTGSWATRLTQAFSSP